ncbi:hypothetical protein GCM10008107_02890 [Psychrosphaera saromensis]|uniref:EpsG family protein n=1 Tax=Psychrosphaera saromensis TaxID=716813 RepID=A0A2S7UYG6_9GAMM|nr:EpsG family protein [Psychrosphaera saromensis]PQJ54755.1 hypothetical protein BTO11_14585 [Psychrosphaera saromensis]GHB57411.1 hypothetical protein GCM10008107_02890 [Psychrosphaera saromensis]GLQ14011.1 hypothetical protein GCM10007917_14660 [Psychrosphaera saromensis]
MINQSKSISNKSIDSFLFYSLAFLLILIAGFRPFGFDKDSLGYATLVNLAVNGKLAIEPTFILISKLSYLISPGNPERITILIYSVLNISIISLIIHKYSNAKFVSLLAYFLLFYPLLTLTQIRFGIACAIFGLSIKDIVDKRFLSFLFKTIIATMFHYSAVLILPLYFLSTKTLNKKFYLLLIIFSFIFSFFSSGLISLLVNNLVFLPTYIETKLQQYLVYKDYAEFNVINSFSIILISIFFVTLLKAEKLQVREVVMLKVLGIGIAISLVCSFFPTLSVRILYLYGIVSIFMVIKMIGMFSANSKGIFFVFIFYLYLLVAYKINYVNGLLNFELVGEYL